MKCKPTNQPTNQPDVGIKQLFSNMTLFFHVSHLQWLCFFARDEQEPEYFFKKRIILNVIIPSTHKNTFTQMSLNASSEMNLVQSFQTFWHRITSPEWLSWGWSFPCLFTRSNNPWVPLLSQKMPSGFPHRFHDGFYMKLLSRCCCHLILDKAQKSCIIIHIKKKWQIQLI